MKRAFFISLAFLLFLSFNTKAQYLKYHDIKNDYSTQGYHSIITYEKYSPLAAGLTSYFLPGLGHFYVREPLRGVCFLGGELASATVVLVGFVTILGEPIDSGNYHDEKIHGRNLLIGGMLAGTIIQIWSICDAIKIAKIKNLAIQENRMSVQINPVIDFLKPTMENNSSPCYGLSLNINF